jgi:hypothetical protein
MFHLGLVDVIVAEREREIEENLRRRRLMKPEAGAAESVAPVRRASDCRPMAVRVRPSGG